MLSISTKFNIFLIAVFCSFSKVLILRGFPRNVKEDGFFNILVFANKAGKFEHFYSTGLFLKSVFFIAKIRSTSVAPGKIKGFWKFPEPLILLVAGEGFEPTTFRLWAWRATKLLYPAIILTSDYIIYLQLLVKPKI